MVRGALEELPSVMVVEVSYSKRRADVLFDPAQVTVEQMATALRRYGYRAAPLPEG